MKKTEAKKAESKTAQRKQSVKVLKLPKPNKNMTLWGGVGIWPWQVPKE